MINNISFWWHATLLTYSFVPNYGGGGWGVKSRLNKEVNKKINKENYLNPLPPFPPSF